MSDRRQADPAELLRDRARAVLQPEVFDFFAGGAGDQTATDEAAQAWRRFRFHPHVLRDVHDVDLRSAVLGDPLPHPVLVAPTAWHGLLDDDGELATARGAAEAGAVLVVSTRSSRRIEEVAAVAGRWWLQVYVTRDRRLTESLVRRTADAGAEALVLTGDTPYIGRKRTGRPVGLDDRSAIANFVDDLRPGDDPAVAAEQDPTITMDAIGWLARISGLPVLVKGVLRPDDAIAAVDAGAAGLVVSNHGGRQLPRAVHPADVLAAVVDAVPGTPVLVDGGLRSGDDVLAALALGARAVLLGRPVLWGLATGSSTGVAEVLDDVVDSLRFGLQLLGVGGLRDLRRDHVSRIDRVGI